jgi:hypothetical protein
MPLDVQGEVLALVGRQEDTNLAETGVMCV